MALSPETLLEVLGASPAALDCGGLRLHLDRVFAFRGPGLLGSVNKKLAEVEEVPPANGIYKLEPGAYKVRYREVVRVPQNAVAMALPRSTLLRMGATIYTALWDPGYEGRGEGLLVVFNPYGIEIEVGAQVAQLLFIRLDRETSFVYRGSYQRENL